MRMLLTAKLASAARCTVVRVLRSWAKMSVTRTVTGLAGGRALAMVPRIASAQFDAATVLGAVIDATGARVPGATVTLKNADTGIVSTAVTDSEGNYKFLNVRIGT